MVATRNDVTISAEGSELFAGGALVEGGVGANLFDRAASRCGRTGEPAPSGASMEGCVASADDSMAGMEIEARDVICDEQRARLLGEIVELNPTATSAFLSLFTGAQLAEYRDHLIATREPRGRVARWERRASTPAIVWRDADAVSRRVREGAARGALSR